LPRKIDLAGEQQLAVRRLRPALRDGHVEAVFLVSAVGEGLVEAAMLGLGEPVGAEGDLGEAAARRLRRLAPHELAVEENGAADDDGDGEEGQDGGADKAEEHGGTDSKKEP
jgi:hypothetical protein